jgi:hypothetical protein
MTNCHPRRPFNRGGRNNVTLTSKHPRARMHLVHVQEAVAWSEHRIPANLRKGGQGPLHSTQSRGEGRERGGKGERQVVRRKPCSQHLQPTPAANTCSQQSHLGCWPGRDGLGKDHGVCGPVVQAGVDKHGEGGQQGAKKPRQAAPSLDLFFPLTCVTPDGIDMRDE